MRRLQARGVSVRFGALQALERNLIVTALRLEKGIQARAARRLGISRSNLNYRIQKLEISVQDVIYE